MPRWRALPDELDPQVREFAVQLRRIVDRGGLSLSVLADRTGYSRTSWERYLNGRMLAPKGAIVALAEATDTNPAHLATMWELAERAWSRAELRQDRTMEALQISRARAVPGEFGPPRTEAKGNRGRVAAMPGVAGPAGVSPTLPPRRADREVEAQSSGSSGFTSSSGSVGSSGSSGSAGSAGSSGHSGEDGGRRWATFFAGVAGVVGVAVVGLLVTGSGSDTTGAGAAKSPTPSPSTSVVLPAGVKCSGAACNGKDAEAMGCSGNLVTTADGATVGTTLVEVRYSKTCGAVWGRITQAGPGDAVQLVVGAKTEKDTITVSGDTIAYTPMVAVRDADQARACVTLASGQRGCTS